MSGTWLQTRKTVFYCGAILTLFLSPILNFAAADNAAFSPCPTGAALAQSAVTKDDKLPPCLAEIAQATVLEDASLRSGKMRANVVAVQKLGNAAHDDLVGLLKSATPAGRVMSLELLRIIDASHYGQYVAQVRSESGDSSVSYISASERCHYTVNDILNDIASAHPSIKIVP